ncbi:MAG: hypothetical protein ACXVC6_12015 [Bacteroidia bacterium]
MVLNLTGKVLAAPLMIYKENSPFRNFFFESVFGFILITTIVAIFTCGIYTIAIIMAVILGFYYYKNRKKPFKPTVPVLPSTKMVALYLPLLSICCTLFSFIILFNSGIRADTVYYAHIAETFAEVKKEGAFHFFSGHDKVFDGTLPYHYMEMWLGAFFFKVFSWTSYSNVILYKYAVYNALRLLVVIGLIAIAEKFKPVTLITVFIVLLLSVCDLTYFTNLIEDSFPSYTNMWIRVNFITYYIFGISILLSLNESEIDQSVFFFLSGVVASITTGPALLGGAGILLLFFVIFKKEYRKRAFALIGIVAVFTVCVSAFYKLTGADAATLSGGMPMTLSYMIKTTLSIWKAIIRYSVVLFAESVLILAVGLIPVLILQKKETINVLKNSMLLIGFTLAVSMAGILFFQLVPYMDNTYQFVFVGYVICYIMLIYFIFSAQKAADGTTKNLVFYAFCALFISVAFKYKQADLNLNLNNSTGIVDMNLINTGIGNETITTLKEEFNKNSGRIGASVIAEKDILTKNYLRHILTSQIGFYISYLQNKTCIFLVNDPERLYTDRDSSFKDYLKSQNFNKYTEFYKGYNNKISYPENIKKYIQKEKISYITLSPSYDYHEFDFLNPRKYFVDKNTGVQFLMLNQPGLNNP